LKYIPTELIELL